MAIAEEYQDFAPVVEQIDRLTADEAVQLHCEARERANIHEQAMQRKINSLEGAMQEKDAVLQEMDAALQKKDAEIARLLSEMKKTKDENHLPVD